MLSEKHNDRRQVADVVAERIERLIVDGVLKVGQALPSERRLCEKLGISRSALREGLRVLRGRGIIETAQGRGSFVAQLSDSHDASPLMHLFNSQPRTLYDLLEVRALLEGESARLAALRGTEADFILLRRRYEEMLAAHADGEGADPREHARLDHAFHLAICEASHNPVLVHTLQSLTDLMLSTVFASVNNLYHRPPPSGRSIAAFAALPCRHRAPAGSGAARGARPHPQHSRQPQGNRAGGAATGAGDHAVGGLGVKPGSWTNAGGLSILTPKPGPRKLTSGLSEYRLVAALMLGLVEQAIHPFEKGLGLVERAWYESTDA